MSCLDNLAIREQLRRAWEESRPGTSDAHEEGGFILRNADGSLTVERWSVGLQDQITVPAHVGGIRGNRSIIATFHTHPNPGEDFQQEPSLTDIRAVGNDVDLHHSEFEGEYVFASELTYRILQNGRVEVLGNTKELLGLS